MKGRSDEGQFVLELLRWDVEFGNGMMILRCVCVLELLSGERLVSGCQSQDLRRHRCRSCAGADSQWELLEDCRVMSEESGHAYQPLSRQAVALLMSPKATGLVNLCRR